MAREYSPPTVILVFEVALAALCVSGVALNALVARRLRRRRLALAWAACNVLAIVKSPLLVTTLHQGQWPAGRLLCSTYMASAVLQLWVSPWLLALATLHLCFKNRLLRRIATCFCCLLFGTAMVMVFASTAHLSDEEKSSCVVLMAPDDVFWTTLTSFLFSFYTPTTVAACFLLLATFQMPRLGPKLNSTVAMLISQVVCFILYWVTQLRLLDDEPMSSPRVSIQVYLLAGLVMDLHVAVAVPCLLLWGSRERDKLDEVVEEKRTSESLDGFLESLRAEQRQQLTETA